MSDELGQKAGVKMTESGAVTAATGLQQKAVLHGLRRTSGAEGFCARALCRG